MTYSTSAFALTALLISGAQQSACGGEFEVHAGGHARQQSIVRVSLPESVPGDFDLIDVASQNRVPYQVNAEDDALVFILPEPMAKGESRRFRITTQTAPKVFPVRAESRLQNGTLQMRVDERPVLSYHTQVRVPPEGTDPVYRRSGHIHPLLTPSGKIVTDEFPADHLHQHAIFAAWVKTTFEDRPVDFWNQKAGTGTVQHRRLVSHESGPVWASFTSELAHADLSIPGGIKDVLHETWTVRAYAVSGINLFELTSTQTCVAETPLTAEEYHYGGFAYRGSGEWNLNNGDFLTSEGKNRETGNHTRPNWVAIYGTVDGGPCGAAMFSHPNNFRSPQPVRLHPKMPYFVFTPPVLGAFDFPPGVPYVSQYRYASFDGEPDPERLEQIWIDYAHPPKVHWIR